MCTNERTRIGWIVLVAVVAIGIAAPAVAQKKDLPAPPTKAEPVKRAPAGKPPPAPVVAPEKKETAPGPAAPVLRSAAPARVELRPGADGVRVKLLGSGLDAVSGAQILRRGRPVAGIAVAFEGADASAAVLVLKLEGDVTPGTDYRARLIGPGSASVDVPLQIAVVAATIPPSRRQDPRRTPSASAPVVPPPEPASEPAPSLQPTGVEIHRDVARPRLATALVVRVEEDGGDRVPGADVCLGTPDRPTQYGVVRTNAAGDARFPNPPAEVDLQVIVSKTGFEGRIDEVDFDPDPDHLQDCGPYSVASDPGEPAGVFDPDDAEDCDPVDVDTVEIDAGEGGPQCPPRGRLQLRVEKGAGGTACLGTTAAFSAYGGALLSSEGIAVFEDLPLGEVVRVTVDKPGFERVEDGVLLTTDVAEREYTLREGEGGGQIALEGAQCVALGQVAVTEVPEAGPAQPPMQTVVGVAATPGGPRAVYAQLPGGGVIDAATPNGFGFTAEGDGCALDANGFFQLGGLRCVFRLFQGRLLQPGWTAVAVTIYIDDRVIWEYRDVIANGGTEPARDLSFAIETEGNPLPSSAIPGPPQLPGPARFEVTLEGPAGADWRDAFAPAVAEALVQYGPVPASEYVPFARGRGYAFVAEPMNDRSLCAVETDGTLVIEHLPSVPGIQPGARCRYRLLMGPRLRPGWGLFDVAQVVSPQIGGVSAPSWDRDLGAEPVTVLDLRAVGGRFEAQTRITLIGPPGGAWQDAFGP